jgi:hypothetical protein
VIGDISGYSTGKRETKNIYNGNAQGSKRLMTRYGVMMVGKKRSKGGCEIFTSQYIPQALDPQPTQAHLQPFCQIQLAIFNVPTASPHKNKLLSQIVYVN